MENTTFVSPQIIHQNQFRLSLSLMIRKGLLRTLTQPIFTKKPDASNTVTPLNVKPKNKAYLPQAIIQANRNKPKILPPSEDSSKLTVVMELDEVLAFTFVPDEEGYMMSPRRKQDFHLWFEEFEVLLNIYKRKNLDNFLSYLSEECEPVIFATGVRSYVELVMGLIDPTRKIKHILCQQSCDRIVEQQSKIDEYVKDLQLLGRDMSRVVYLDSKPMAFWLYPQNSIGWEQFKADNQMKSEDLDDILIEIEKCRKEKDCRDYLLKQFNLREDFVNSNLL